MARLFGRYNNDRTGNETFQEFCLRHSDEKLAEFLAAPVPAFSGTDGDLHCAV